jgi:predicted small integral membrane protein
MALSNHLISRRITPLNDVNYVSWAKEMRAYLAENRIWFIVNGTITEPKSGKEQVTYMKKSTQAAGAMFLAVEASQHVHFNWIEMDGPAIWAKLQSTHLQKVSGVRYNALDAVFNVRKQSDKSLPSLVSRVDTLVQSFKDLCPGRYTLEQLLEDMSAMSIL